MKEILKIAFVDIDGVLNHQLWFEKTQKSYNSRKERMIKYYLANNSIELLNSFYDATKAGVVISSSHRIGWSLKELKEIFKKAGYNGNVIGKTPKLYFKNYNKSVPRGIEIQAWLENNINIDENKILYVIFDDDSDFLLSQKENYFRVDNYCGITPNLIYRAINFLNRFD